MRHMNSDNRVSALKGSSIGGTCSKCHLPKRVARKGSITSWLFAPPPQSHCTCESSASFDTLAASTLATSAHLIRKLDWIPETLLDQSSGETMSLPELSETVE